MRSRIIKLISSVGDYKLISLEEDGENFKITLKYEEYEFDILMHKSLVEIVESEKDYNARILLFSIILHKMCRDAMYPIIKYCIDRVKE